jgi:crotonobetainyl-CoA:carnitine CoA-transferase CaiB-like acyl-CoA transferase
MYTGIHGVASVCAALLGRIKSGRGQHLDLALYDCMVSMHEYAVQCYTLSGGKEIPVQTGHDLPQSTVYGVFTATDGYLVIAAQVDDAWRRLAKLIGGESLAADKRFLDPANRNANREAALQYVRNWVAAQPNAKSCLDQLNAVGVPCAKVQRIDEVLADPQVIARGMMVEQEHPVLGKVRLPNLPFRFSDCDTSPKSCAPLMGQHNRDIATDLGYSGSDIARLEGDGVLYAEDAVRELRST